MSKVPLARRYFTDPLSLRPDLYPGNIFKPSVATKAFEKSLESRCPICNNDSLSKGEMCDVEVGMVQISPDTCLVCGYIQPGADWKEGDNDFNSFMWCWEMQVWPWSYGEPE